MHSAILITILFLGISVIASAAVAERPVPNKAQIPPLHYEDQTGFIDVVLKEAGRFCIEVFLLKLSSEMAIFNPNARIYDGFTDRISGLEKFYPDLIPIPETVLEFEWVAFAKGEDG